LPELCRHIHRIIGELLPAKNFLVALHDKSRNTLSFPYFVDARVRGREPHALASGTPIAQVIGTGRSLLTATEDAGATAAVTPEPARANWLGVPLISQHGVMGALVVRSEIGDVCYTEEHRDLLQFVSTQIATVIERKQAESRLQHMALHDDLTDLPNRTLFYDRFDTALRRADRNGEHLGQLYLDLDEFMQVNDTFGHEAGDLLLREVARRLVQCVRGSDTVGRLGGDEFTVLLTNIRGPDSVNFVAAKVRAAITAPFDLHGTTLTMSASIGTAVYPEHGKDRDQVFRHADASMYAAKVRDDLAKGQKRKD
jgi:diguanylate cyclase (GGDEF)-like protein